MKDTRKPWGILRRYNQGDKKNPIYSWSLLGVWWFKPEWKPELPAEGLRIALFPTRKSAREAVLPFRKDFYGPFKVVRLQIAPLF